MLKKISLLFILFSLTFFPLLAQQTNLKDLKDKEKTDYYTLADAITITTENNLSILKAKQNIDKMRAGIQTGWSMVFPKLTLNANYTKLDSYSTRQILPPGANSEFNYYGTKASVNQLLFANYIIPTLEIADYALQSSIAEYEATIDFVLYNLNIAYYTVLRAENLQKIAQNSLNITNEHVKINERMQEIGIINKANLYQTYTRQKENENQLTETEKLIKMAKLNFNYITNRNLDKDFALDGQNLEKIAFANLEKVTLDNLDIFVEKALNRPNMQVLYKNKEILNRNIFVNESNYYPNVFLTGNYGYTNPNAYTIKYNDRDWNVAVALSWTVFDGWLTTSKVNAAKSDSQQMDTTIEINKKQIKQEILDAMLSIKIAKENINSSKAQIKFATESYNLMKEQYKNGLSTNQELLDAELSYTISEVNYSNALFDLILAKKKLNYLTGEI